MIKSKISNSIRVFNSPGFYNALALILSCLFGFLMGKLPPAYGLPFIIGFTVGAFSYLWKEES